MRDRTEEIILVSVHQEQKKSSQAAAKKIFCAARHCEKIFGDGGRKERIRRTAMLERYKTIYLGGEGEIVEKKSRFIATVRLVETEEEAQAFIEAMRKKYWNATHNCFAYVIGERRELVRCSDDGEPQGTAGRPMLDVLLGEEIYNVAVVVTRYFGGTLLGTGGLVRAYSQAVQEGIAKSIVIQRQYGAVLEIGTDYNSVGKIQYLIGQRRLPILDSQYTDRVTMKVLIPHSQVEEVKAQMVEATSGRAGLSVTDRLYYAVLDGKILMGEELAVRQDPVQEEH